MTTAKAAAEIAENVAALARSGTLIELDELLSEIERLAEGG